MGKYLGLFFLMFGVVMAIFFMNKLSYNKLEGYYKALISEGVINLMLKR